MIFLFVDKLNQWQFYVVTNQTNGSLLFIFHTIFLFPLLKVFEKFFPNPVIWKND